MDYKHGFKSGRIVKESGKFVNVSHSINDFGEFTTIARNEEKW